MEYLIKFQLIKNQMLVNNRTFKVTKDEYEKLKSMVKNNQKGVSRHHREGIRLNDEKLYLIFDYIKQYRYGRSIDQIVKELCLARGTVSSYLMYLSLTDNVHEEVYNGITKVYFRKRNKLKLKQKG